MFSSKNKKSSTMTKKQETAPTGANMIEAGTQITGEIKTNGDIRFNGKLIGNIITKGKLIVGPSGVIVGDINCKNSEIAGKVDGKILVSELLSLKKSAKVHGEIITNKISIEPGAIFTGSCDMDNKSISDARKIGGKRQEKAIS